MVTVTTTLLLLVCECAVCECTCCPVTVWPSHKLLHYSVLPTAHCSPLQSVPQTLLQRYGVAAVRGVARNKNITEFQLEPWIDDQKVVDDILAQLTPDEKRKFRVGKDALGYPSIELCPVGE